MKFSWLVGISVVAGMSAQARDCKLTVNIRDRGIAEHREIVEHAEALAAKMFHEIDIDWRSGTGRSKPVSHSCGAPIVLSIDANADKAPASKGAFAYAMPFETSGTLIHLFMDRITGSNGQAFTAVLLAHVMVHEITHVLEKTGEHSPEGVMKAIESKFPSSSSRNGRFLLYTSIDPKTKSDIWVLPLKRGAKPVPFLVTKFSEREARFSPDGRWVAYTSNESGQSEVYVRSFSINPSGTSAEAGAKWSISNGFGVEPHWRGDGRELYFRSRDDQVSAVEITTSPEFRAGNPKPLGVPVGLGWDSLADGTRFLSATHTIQPFRVVLNWQSGLKR